MRKAINGIDGIADSQIKLPLQQATLKPRSISRRRRYGLKPGDVNLRQPHCCQVFKQEVFEEQKCSMWWCGARRKRGESTGKDLLIDTPGGGQMAGRRCACAHRADSERHSP